MKQSLFTRSIQHLISSTCIVLSLLAVLSEAQAGQIKIYSNGGGFKTDINLCLATSSYQTNNPKTLVFMGGGSDIAGAYQTMVRSMCAMDVKGQLQPGNFVVIRADNDSKYDKYIYNLAQGLNYPGTNIAKVGSVTTIVVQQQLSTLAADDLALIKTYLDKASAVFITGGDQYYYAWQYTSGGINPIVSQISNLVTNYNVPLGGTSAGMMVMSPINYIGNPNYGTLSSYNAIAGYNNALPSINKAILPNANAYPPYQFWTLPGFFSYFPVLLDPKNKTAAVVDSHFYQRDRMGRLLSFMYAFSTNSLTSLNWKLTNTSTSASIPNIVGIGIDPQTAMILRSKGTPGSSSLTNSIEVISNLSTTTYSGDSTGIYFIDASNSQFSNGGSSTSSLVMSNLRSYKISTSAQASILSNPYQTSTEKIVYPYSNVSGTFFVKLINAISNIAISQGRNASLIATCQPLLSTAVTCVNGTTVPYGY